MGAPKDPIKREEWIEKLSNAHKGKNNSSYKYHQKSISLYESDPKHCKACKKQLPYEKRRNIYCNHKCQCMYDHPMSGKHHSEETRKNMSISHIGVNAGEKNPMYWVRLCGESNGFYGKRHTLESKREMSTKALERVHKSGWSHPIETRIKIGKSNRGKLLGTMKSDETRRKVSIGNAGKKRTEECCKNLSDRMTGLMVREKHPNWKGGISREPYSPLFDKIYKKSICENQTCLVCGKHGGKLVAHHWDYDKMSFNCVPVHLGCNSKANFYREWYQMAFNVRYGGQPFIMRVA